MRLLKDKNGEDILKVPSYSVTVTFFCKLLDEKSFMQRMGNFQASVSSALVLCNFLK